MSVQNKSMFSRIDLLTVASLVLEPSGRIRYRNCVDLLVGQTLCLQARQNVVDDVRVSVTAESDLHIFGKGIHFYQKEIQHNY